jgi:hypothetical protein
MLIMIKTKKHDMKLARGSVNTATPAAKTETQLVEKSQLRSASFITSLPGAREKGMTKHALPTSDERATADPQL